MPWGFVAMVAATCMAASRSQLRRMQRKHALACLRKVLRDDAATMEAQHSRNDRVSPGLHCSWCGIWVPLDRQPCVELGNQPDTRSTIVSALPCSKDSHSEGCDGELGNQPAAASDSVSALPLSKDPLSDRSDGELGNQPGARCPVASASPSSEDPEDAVGREEPLASTQLPTCSLVSVFDALQCVSVSRQLCQLLSPLLAKHVSDSGGVIVPM